MTEKESYKALLRVLESYEPKRLGYGALHNGNGLCCTLGAYALVMHGDPRETALELAPDVRHAVIRANDQHDFTPEARYDRMLAWLRERAA